MWPRPTCLAAELTILEHQRPRIPRASRTNYMYVSFKADEREETTGQNQIACVSNLNLSMAQHPIRASGNTLLL